MPTEPSPQSIKEILEKGKHVILKGPPGTGKTHLAMKTDSSWRMFHSR